MLKLSTTSRFDKDLKLCQKRGYNLTLLSDVVTILREQRLLPAKYQDHKLSGDYINFRECHVLPDWLLIYRVQNDVLVLNRTGTHSDLFR